MERGLVERESDLPFRSITAAAVKGRGPLELIRNGALLARGTFEALRLLRRERPAAILGTGGYVCVPLFVAARALGIPTMIYLPDIKPGLAVKTLARLATRVACSFEPSLRYLPGDKTVVTGYPVRRELLAAAAPARRSINRAAFGISGELPVLLVYGGSRGARNINRAVEALLPRLLELAEIVHVCGREGDDVWLRAAADRLPAGLRERYHLYTYLFAATPSIFEAFGAADLAVARAGASTLAELPAAGLPAVLVPLTAVDQDINADYLAQRGAAVSVPDETMLGDGDGAAGPLFREVQRLLTDHQARERMAEASRDLARPAAADVLATALLELAAPRGAAA